MKLEVGHIDKAHGLRGEVVVTLLTDRLERVEPGAELFGNDGVLTVAQSRPHQHRFLVLFEEVNGREAAEALRGTTLYAEPLDDPDVLWIHDLINRTVVDTEGNELGQAMSVEQNPASDLLVLNDERLVPLTFFVEYDADDRIVVDPPEGLFAPIDAEADES